MVLCDIGIFIGIVCFAVYSFVIWRQNRWTRKGIAISDPAPILGNWKDVIFQKKNMHEVIKDFYFKNKDKPFVTFYFFTQPHVLLNDMELVKKILIKDFQVFADRHGGASPTDEVAFWNMFISKGEFWRKLRQKLSPTFTSGKLKKMFEVIDACGKEFVCYLGREMDEKGDINVKEAAARYTSDIITSTAFGLEGDAMKNKDSSFRKFMRMIVEPTAIQNIKGLVSSVFPYVAKTLDFRLFNEKASEFVRKTVWSTVEYREKNNVKRNDFLDILMQLRSKGYIEGEDGETHEENGQITSDGTEKVKVVFDGDVFIAQCVLFLTAGFETSSTTMSWALYELAQHPDLQQRVYEEIASVIEKHNGKVTYEAVQEMEYLHRVVQETLRKYPVVPFLDRETLRPYTIPGTGISLPERLGIMIPVMGIHYDPDIYPEPEKFDPERFSPESIQSRPPCSFLGFGDGPRNCIGMRLGLLQTKVGLIYILNNYSVNACDKTPNPIVFEKSNFILSPEGGMTLRLVKRG